MPETRVRQGVGTTESSWIEALLKLNARIVIARDDVSAQAARVMDALEARHDIEAAETRFRLLKDELDALRLARDALLREVNTKE